jgi:hypothetical protein
MLYSNDGLEEFAILKSQVGAGISRTSTACPVVSNKNKDRFRAVSDEHLRVTCSGGVGRFPNHCPNYLLLNAPPQHLFATVTVQQL